MNLKLFKFSLDILFYLVAAIAVLGVLYLMLPSIRVNGNFGASGAVLGSETGEEKLSPEEIQQRASEKTKGLRVPILMYHHVGSLPDNPDEIRKDLTVSKKDFAEQAKWLKDNGYTSLTLEQVFQATQGAFQLPAKPVVFTFDDGYEDVFVNAVPVLLRHGFVGSFAVVPGLAGKPDYATWDQIQNTKQLGMEIVSHTFNHFDGSNKEFDAQYIKTNLEISLAELDNLVGKVPRILVYPYGHYTREYISVARQVGFTMALTTQFGRYVDPKNLMETPRVRVHGEQSLKTFIKNLQ